jgi:hypothetical protein
VDRFVRTHEAGIRLGFIFAIFGVFGDMAARDVRTRAAPARTASSIVGIGNLRREPNNRAAIDR